MGTQKYEAELANDSQINGKLHNWPRLYERGQPTYVYTVHPIDEPFGYWGKL